MEIHLHPDPISKPLKIAFNIQRLSTVGSPIQKVSSAYCMWEIVNPPLFTSKPLNKFLLTALFIKPPKPSATKKKKERGERVTLLQTSLDIYLLRWAPINKNRHISSKETRLHPSNPLLTQTHSYHHVLQKTSIHRIISFLKVHLQNQTLQFCFFCQIHYFIHNQNTIHQIILRL